MVTDGDTELVEELVAAAVNAAMIKAREGAAKSLSSLTGGLPLVFSPTWAARPRAPAARAANHVGLRIRGRVDRLIAALGRFPGIGAKSAERLAHHVLRCPADEALELADAIPAAKEQIKHCQVCFHLTQADQPLCTIC